MRAQPFRRRREGRTNYRKRLKLISSGKTRIVIRRTLKNVIIQFIDFEAKGDRTRLTVVSKELVNLGWKSHTGNIPASYLTGLLAGKKASALKIKEAVVDTGLHTNTKGSRIYAAIKGLIDSGIKINADEKVFPPMEKIKGSNAKNPEIVKTEFESVLKNIEKVK
ncbi:MAG: 50S ribosomal protein L18 [Candidatus Nanoarchaeia archaeon]|nr:50S ribosomal protein L18 [Candidatus Nanoarchaeia archaeon]